MMVEIRLPQTINIPAHYTDHGTGGLTAISSDTEYLSQITTHQSATSISDTNIFNSSNATENIWILN